RGGAAVEHDVYAALEILQHVRRLRRARAREQVRTRGGNRHPCRREERTRNRVRWDTNRDSIQTRGDLQRDARRAWEHERQGARPETTREVRRKRLGVATVSRCVLPRD